MENYEYTILLFILIVCIHIVLRNMRISLQWIPMTHINFFHKT